MINNVIYCYIIRIYIIEEKGMRYKHKEIVLRLRSVEEGERVCILRRECLSEG